MGQKPLGAPNPSGILMSTLSVPTPPHPTAGKPPMTIAPPPISPGRGRRKLSREKKSPPSRPHTVAMRRRRVAAGHLIIPRNRTRPALRARRPPLRPVGEVGKHEWWPSDLALRVEGGPPGRQLEKRVKFSPPPPPPPPFCRKEMRMGGAEARKRSQWQTKWVTRAGEEETCRGIRPTRPMRRAGCTVTPSPWMP